MEWPGITGCCRGRPILPNECGGSAPSMWRLHACVETARFTTLYVVHARTHSVDRKRWMEGDAQARLGGTPHHDYSDFYSFKVQSQPPFRYRQSIHALPAAALAPVLNAESSGCDAFFARGVRSRVLLHHQRPDRLRPRPGVLSVLTMRSGAAAQAGGTS